MKLVDVCVRGCEGGVGCSERLWWEEGSKGVRREEGCGEWGVDVGKVGEGMGKGKGTEKEGSGWGRGGEGAG